MSYILFSSSLVDDPKCSQDGYPLEPAGIEHARLFFSLFPESANAIDEPYIHVGCGWEFATTVDGIPVMLLVSEDFEGNDRARCGWMIALRPYVCFSFLRRNRIAQALNSVTNAIETALRADRRFSDVRLLNENEFVAEEQARLKRRPKPLPPTGTLRGHVVEVLKGDTIIVADAGMVKNKIRLQGIDAPELTQAFGAASKDRLSENIGGKGVFITWKQRDQFLTALGEVYLGDRFINLEMVRDGMAWRKQYSQSKEFADVEDVARRSKRGLWADDSPTPPWEFRKKER